MPRIDVLRRSSTHNPVHVAQVEATKQGQLPTLQKAVVVEVFSDIDVREDFLLYVKNRVTNPYVAGIAPVNSVVAKIISNSAGNAQTNERDVYTPVYDAVYRLIEYVESKKGKE